MKKILFLLITISFIGCKEKDPFSAIKFGKSNYKTTTEDLLKKGLISRSSEDSSTFYSKIKIDNAELPIILYFNSDLYKFGSVRSIYMNLGGDTIYDFAYSDDPYISLGAGPRLYSDVENLYEQYEQWYGTPDSILLDYPPKKIGAGLSIGEYMRQSFQEEKIDSSAIPGKTIYWQTPEYKIKFYFSIPYPETKKDSLLYVKSPSIEYTMLDYEVRLKAIQDSIKTTFNPDDLISMRITNPEWNESIYGGDNIFSIAVRDVVRKDREEDRDVIALKFDIIFTDLFGEELMRMENVTLEPPFPLENGREGLTKILSGPLTYTMPYNSYSKQGQDVIALKNHYKNNKTHINYQINSVVFNDGTVLNRK